MSALCSSVSWGLAKQYIKTVSFVDFHGGPVVGNPLANTGTQF